MSTLVILSKLMKVNAGPRFTERTNKSLSGSLISGRLNIMDYSTLALRNPIGSENIGGPMF